SLGLLGIISIGLAHDYTPADDWFKFVSGTYIAQYPPWGGEEGGWCQGVGYWKWSVRYSAMFFDALSSATGVDMFDKAFCRNNGWYKIYMHPPWCDRHHFGDGNQGAPGGTDRNNLMLYATRYDNPYYKWYADQIPGGQQTDAFAYWWYDYDLPSKPPVDVPQSRYQPDIGWVGMHSDLSDPDEIMLMFKSSWYGSFNHSHADQNHFVVYGYGEPLLIDSGYYDWYGSDHDRNWTRQTKAHNSILVNGEGQPIFDITAKGDIMDYFEGPTGCYTAGDATPAYKGKLANFLRRVVYLRPDVFLVVDDLAADERSNWTWCCHALSEMELDEADRRVTITEGDAHLDIAFASPQKLSMTQDNDWDGHPPQGRFEQRPKNWHTYVETVDEKQIERFVTLMNVRKGGEQPEFESRETPQGNGIEGTLGDLSVVVRTLGEEPVTLLGGSVDADIATISNTDGAMKVFALNATHIDHPDMEMPIFTATEPVTVMLWMDDTGLRSAKVRADAPANVTLMMPGGEQTLLINGAELDDAQCTWDGDAVTLAVQAGEHAITPQAVASVGGGELQLLVDGEPVEMDTQQLNKYTGGALVHGNFEVADGVYAIDSEHPPVPGITINGIPVHPDDPFVWLNENNSIQARLDADTPDGVMMGLESMPCDPEPHITKVVEDVPENAVKIEAENFNAFGLGRPNRYTHRTFLSGGIGVGAWETPGMWLQWNITPPEPGEYYLVVKGATHLPHADRLIMLNGEPIAGQFKRFRFEYTDGYGATPEEWRTMMVVDAEGDPISLTMNEGSNQLRMIAIENLLNLDYLMLVPAT
ncbi:MAG: heparinase II/III family protein, partial [Armatimonadota bacterium]